MQTNRAKTLSIYKNNLAMVGQLVSSVGFLLLVITVAQAFGIKQITPEISHFIVKGSLIVFMISILQVVLSTILIIPVLITKAR